MIPHLAPGDGTRRYNASACQTPLKGDASSPWRCNHPHIALRSQPGWGEGDGHTGRAGEKSAVNASDAPGGCDRHQQAGTPTRVCYTLQWTRWRLFRGFDAMTITVLHAACRARRILLASDARPEQPGWRRTPPVCGIQPAHRCRAAGS